MLKPISGILAEKPAARPRIYAYYAYSIVDAAYTELLKIRQTARA